jgi:diguanylate cyclase (GGDEF)-like protein
VQQLAPDSATSLVLVSIDHFKHINDAYGHQFGDRVLRGIVQAAEREAAPQDRIARVGGDAFVYLATRYDRDSVLQDCRRLLARVAEYEERPDGAKGNIVHVTASAGLTFLEAAVAFDAAIRRADVAMYEAKRRGRQGLVVHDHGADAARDPDAHLRHFENVTKVASERVASPMAAMGRRLLDAARAEAHRDSLTGLLNRRHFDAQMPREVDRARQHDLPLSVALMDLDHFHDVNMTYGWVGGDAVLRASPRW